MSRVRRETHYNYSLLVDDTRSAKSRREDVSSSPAATDTTHSSDATCQPKASEVSTQVDIRERGNWDMTGEKFDVWSP